MRRSLAGFERRLTSVATLKPYRGINPLILQVHAFRHGFKSKFWGTWDQWQRWGCTVKRRPDGVEPGEWGAKIVFFRPINKTVVDQTTGDEEREQFFLMKTWSVFNAEQAEGKVAHKFLVTEEGDASGFCDFQPAEELIAATGASIHHGGESAHYERPRPEGTFPNHEAGDEIHMPVKEKFESPSAYYETLLHELAHFAEVRVGWDWKKETYELGELVAEMASCFLAQELGVPDGNLTNHTTYIGHWLNAMKGDSRFIFRASSQASKVADFILNFVRKEQPQPEHVEVA